MFDPLLGQDLEYFSSDLGLSAGGFGHELVTDVAFDVVAGSFENNLFVCTLRAFDPKEDASRFGYEFPSQGLGPDLQLSQSYAQSLNCEVAVSTFEFEE